MRTATSSHEVRTNTATPPIEPIRTVPGSCGSAGAPQARGGPPPSATNPKYRPWWLSLPKPPPRRGGHGSVGGLAYVAGMTEQLVAPLSPEPQTVVGRRAVVKATQVDGVEVLG